MSLNSYNMQDNNRNDTPLLFELPAEIIEIILSNLDKESLLNFFQINNHAARFNFLNINDLNSELYKLIKMFKDNYGLYNAQEIRSLIATLPNNLKQFLINTKVNFTLNPFNLLAGQVQLYDALTNKDLETDKRLEIITSLLRSGVYISQQAANLANEEIKSFIKKVSEAQSIMSYGIVHDINKNCFYNIRDNNLKTVLFYMIYKGYPISEIEKLLDTGAEVNNTGAIHLVSRANVMLRELTYFENIISLLISKGADINEVCRLPNTYYGELQGEVPLSIALLNNKLRIAEVLYKNGAKINVNINGKPLIVHLFSKWFEKGLLPKEQVRFLLNHAADINATDSEGQTLLHMLCSKGDYINIQKLFELGFNNINAINLQGKTALYVACSNGDEFIIKFLLNKGAKLNIGDNNYKSPFHVVVQRYLEFSNYLACSYEPLPLISLSIAFLNIGLNIISKPFTKKPLLQCIVKPFDNVWFWPTKKYERILRLITKEGNINQIDSKGRTVLHLACKDGNIKLVSLLLELGADINIVDSKGCKAIDYALSNYEITKKSNYNIILEMLNKVDNSPITPRIYASNYPSSINYDIVSNQSIRDNQDRLNEGTIIKRKQI
ncbi:MAG: ankyrin repeat domain-containing protein [Sphingobacteriia bacterium]|nr:ankyrin repeat domain-containing protein [Sphingobacteriia bacterium]